MANQIGWGGKRDGSGRKREGELVKVTVAGRISPEARAKLDNLCRSHGKSIGQMLEELIEKAAK